MSHSNSDNTKQQLRFAKNKIARLEAEIAVIKSSKFWKLRELWMKIKPRIPGTSAHSPYQALNQEASYSPERVNYNLPQPLPRKQLSILFVVEESIEHCFRYRVHQKLEQCDLLGEKSNWISWKHPELVRYLLPLHQIIIFYRVPAFTEVMAMIKLAKALNKIVIFDIDDLIFAPQWYPEPYENYQQQLSYEEYRGLVEGVKLYHEALSLCDFAIASTPPLQEMMAEVIGREKVFCLRNGLDQPILNFLQSPPQKCQREYLSIFYGSGTKTHDSDFAQVASVIANLLEKYPQLRLTLIGYLTLPAILTPYSHRIDRVEFLTNAEAYWQLLTQADINIAPLSPGKFNDCKSEIKWLEAAVFSIPSVVSATATYRELLTDGEDALMASTPQEWEDKLEALIVDVNYRSAIAQQARQKAFKEYSPSCLSQQLQTIFHQTIDIAKTEGKVTNQSQKIKLLFVNLLYPPQSLGGATALLKNTLDYLRQYYSDRYELFVFTTDWENATPYQLQTETVDGVYVTRLSTPAIPDQDWRYQDATIYRTFSEYLESIQPDLIHFHCIQRLTASTLEATHDLNIPFFVSLHDAWWLGDCQFLIDRNGNPCNPQLNDPLIAARYSENISATLQRQRYLALQLKKAEKLLAVSHSQSQLYHQNGFPETLVSRNGIPEIPRKPRQPSKKLRLGYAGGICSHKGYYLLKQAIQQANLQNTTLTVIDLFASKKKPREEKWGNTPVQIIPKIPFEQMPEFYRQIDVLVAPSIWPESFGLITREATMAGVWVIASNLGALAEDIKPGVHGDTFPPDHPEELVTILQKIDRNPEAYQQPLPIEKTNHIRTLKEQVEELNQFYSKIIHA